jgi:DNA-binding NarL/FixJ family response regulator
VISLGIVDDHPTFRVGLRRLFEQEEGMRVAWDCGNLTDMATAIASDPVDAVLMDLYLGPDQDSLAATRRLVVQMAVTVIVISASSDDEAVTAAQHAGAKGYIPKDLPVAEMVAAVKHMTLEQTAGAAFIDLARDARGAAGPGHGFTPRELEVVAELRRGRTNREIAGRLGVSITTVNKHVQQVLNKLNVKNRAQALARLHRDSLGGFSKPSGALARTSGRRAPKSTSSR